MKALLLPLAVAATLAGGTAYAQVVVNPNGTVEGQTSPWQAVPGYSEKYEDRTAINSYSYYGSLPLSRYIYGGVPGYVQDAHNGQRYRDRNRDGIPDQLQNDRDGDGVPNAYDRRPDDPRRR